MAGHLAGAGHDVVVFNRTASRASAWVERYGGRAAATPAAAVAGAAAVFVCVGDDDDVRAVVRGEDGALAAMAGGSLLIDHTTTSAQVAREIARAASEVGVAFLDAPVTGGQAGAEGGTLSVMVGGEEEHFERARPLLEAYSRRIRRMGPAGAGQLAKMVNQICIAGIVEGLAEGLHFARCSGLDPLAVVDAICEGAAGSWQMTNRHRTMADGHFDFGFAVDWMRKDLGHVLAEARRSGARLPLTALVDQLYAEVQAMGGGRWDTSSLIARLEASRRDVPRGA